jgi:hypothetical protein
MPTARSSCRNALVLSVAALPGSSDYPTRYLPTLWQLPVPGVCLRHLKSKWRTNIHAVNSGVMTSSSLFFFFLLSCWGWSISHEGVLILCDTVHTSSPWEIFPLLLPYQKRKLLSPQTNKFVSPSATDRLHVRCEGHEVALSWSSEKHASE